MNRIVDELMLSAPLSVAFASIYFVYFWKPRQKNPEKVTRTESIFWSAALTVLVLVVVYAAFFRG
jgi:heme A synthase